METTLNNYRVYSLDGSNKIASASWVEAETLAAAIEQVQEHHPHLAFEIWVGTERVAHVPASSQLIGGV